MAIYGLHSDKIRGIVCKVRTFKEGDITEYLYDFNGKKQCTVHS